MVEILTKIAGRDVIASGSLVLPSGDETALFKFSGVELKFIFEATEDKKLLIVGEIENPKNPTTLLLRLKNFNEALGAAYSATMGSLDNRRLNVAVFVHAVGGPNFSRLLSYTFSLGEVEDGQQA